MTGRVRLLASEVERWHSCVRTDVFYWCTNTKSGCKGREFFGTGIPIVEIKTGILPKESPAETIEFFYPTSFTTAPFFCKNSAAFFRTSP
jgi:hypothetical protein